MRDATVAALSDAQFVAPLVQTADLLSAAPTPGVPRDNPSPKAFFYVFDYQTKDGDYPQVRIFKFLLWQIYLQFPFDKCIHIILYA